MNTSNTSLEIFKAEMTDKLADLQLNDEAIHNRVLNMMRMQDAMLAQIGDNYSLLSRMQSDTDKKLNEVNAMLDALSEVRGEK